VFWVSTDRAAIRMLAKKNVEFAIVEFNAGNGIIRSDLKFNNILSLARLTDLRIFAYMHKRHAKVAKKVATTLDKMKSQGDFRSIVAKASKEYLTAIESGSANTAQ
jgi:ABC-type amino acid transport substrate-binding protein